MTSERTPDYIDLEVTNPNVDGLALRSLPFAAEVGVVFSRLLRGGTVTVPEDDSVVRLGDGLRLVGPKAKLTQFEPVIGRKSAIDIKSVPSELTTEHLYVTKRQVLGKSLGDLNFERAYGAVVTRITRADVEFAANDSVRLQFGDSLFVIGSEEGVAQDPGAFYHRLYLEHEAVKMHVETAKREATAQLSLIAEQMRANGLQAEPILRHGNPYEEIVNTAKEIGVDLIVKNVVVDGFRDSDDALSEATAVDLRNDCGGAFERATPTNHKKDVNAQ
jgi:Trk K+ transport system NAD-binding subunit